MDPGSASLVALALTVVALGAATLARRTPLPDPVALCLIGIVAALVPGMPHVSLDPKVVFLLFLPPLVFRSSFLTSPRTLRENATPLALLAVGLVLVTAGAVALAVDLLVPGMTFTQGLVLGAVVAPTDPVAAAGIFSRIGAPRRVVDLVESESLINDATALVLYAVAVQAVLEGPPTAMSAAGHLVLSVGGGVAVGAVVAIAVAAARRVVTDVGLVLGFSLVTPYLAYLPAAAIGASGVLAVVTTGVALGAVGGARSSPAVRLQSSALWSLVDLLLNAVLFLLLGLQVPRIVQDGPGGAVLAGAAVAVVLVVLGVRVGWQFLVPPIAYRVRALAGRPESRSTPSERLIIGWVGMRGAVSLAAALALPLDAEGRPFPGRSVVLVLTVAVVLSTLVLQGVTLAPLLRRLQAADPRAEQEAQARQTLADVALARLDELESSGSVEAGGTALIRQVWEQARARLDGEPPADEVDLVALRLDVARTQGEELDRRARAGQIAPDVARRLRQELDLQELRLRQDTPTA